MAVGLQLVLYHLGQLRMGHTQHFNLAQYREDYVAVLIDQIARHSTRTRIHNRAVRHSYLIRFLIKRHCSLGSLTLHIDVENVVGLNTLREFTLKGHNRISCGILHIGDVTLLPARNRQQQQASNWQ